MDAPHPPIELTLIPAEDDQFMQTYADVQEEISCLGLKISFKTRRGEWFNAERCFGDLFIAPHWVDFSIKFAAANGPVLGTVVGAWLRSRYGRKVRLKIGEIEAEAQTMEELEKLLAHA